MGRLRIIVTPLKEKLRVAGISLMWWSPSKTLNSKKRVTPRHIEYRAQKPGKTIKTERAG